MAAKRRTGKKTKTTKTRATPRSSGPILKKIADVLRTQPKEYEKLHKALKAARTDKGRARILVRFATSRPSIQAVLPPGEVLAAAKSDTGSLTHTEGKTGHGGGGHHGNGHGEDSQ